MFLLEFWVGLDCTRRRTVDRNVRIFTSRHIFHNFDIFTSFWILEICSETVKSLLKLSNVREYYIYIYIYYICVLCFLMCFGLGWVVPAAARRTETLESQNIFTFWFWEKFIAKPSKLCSKCATLGNPNRERYLDVAPTSHRVRERETEFETAVAPSGGKVLSMNALVRFILTCNVYFLCCGLCCSRRAQSNETLKVQNVFEFYAARFVIFETLEFRDDLWICCETVEPL